MAAKKLILFFLLFSAFALTNVKSSDGVYSDYTSMISSLDQLPKCQDFYVKTRVKQFKSMAHHLEITTFEQVKQLRETKGEIYELKQIIRDKKKILREKSKLSKFLERDIKSKRAMMRNIRFEADSFPDELTQVYGKWHPQWLGVRLRCFQITEIGELMKQPFSTKELTLFWAGALLPLLLVLVFKPRLIILSEKAKVHPE